jgi:hypothetical protein
VVAEDGAPFIGQSATMTVTSSLQTSAGRLIFARIGPDTPSATGESPLEQPAGGETPPPTEPAPISPEPPDAAPVNGSTDHPPARSPYPPKPPCTIKSGTPRNPRR